MLSTKSTPKAARESWFDNLDDGADTPDLHAAIRTIAQQASKIGRESAEVRGLIDDTGKASESSAKAVAALGIQVKDINGAQGARR